MNSFICVLRPHNAIRSLRKVVFLKSDLMFSNFMQICTFQATFLSNQPSKLSHRAMSTVSTDELDIDRVVTYWFEDSNKPLFAKWFGGGPDVDSEIRERFSALCDTAHTKGLQSWTDKPKGTLALILLLDQFSRNLHRGSSLSHAQDATCLDIAAKAIAKGFDLEVPVVQQPFFYLPLMHDENLVSQVAAMALYNGFIARCQTQSDPQLLEYAYASRDFSKRHLDTILRFGRYPSRNGILGRETTPEEAAFLKENPTGF